MVDAKQILVVDDHFEMLEFLRSMLELSNQEYEVRAVPSAEEGILEMTRTQFDLIISDVRLPGISGFEFARRLRKTGYETPVIMITAYSSDQGRQEAKTLEIYKYFEKPLDTDDVLTAVHAALHGEEDTDTSASITSDPTAVSANVKRRLDTLRTDTGAIQLMLATREGQVVYASGNHELDLPALSKIIARNINDSFELAKKLGTQEPFSLQYHAGEQIELYCANVGESHFLTLFFDASARRGRIGTIWVFTQRAISDLQVMLTIETEVVEVETPLPELQPVEQETGQEEAEVAAPAVNTPVEAELPPLPTLRLEQIEASESDLAALFTSESTGEEVDLDSFWDDAVPVDGTATTGISLEEAREKGLFGNQDEGA